MTVVDCRSDEGITVAMIDSIILMARLLACRNLDSPPVVEALKDLASDEDISAVYDRAKQEAS